MDVDDGPVVFFHSDRRTSSALTDAGTGTAIAIPQPAAAPFGRLLSVATDATSSASNLGRKKCRRRIRSPRMSRRWFLPPAVGRITHGTSNATAAVTGGAGVAGAPRRAWQPKSGLH